MKMGFLRLKLNEETIKIVDGSFQKVSEDYIKELYSVFLDSNNIMGNSSALFGKN
jgi:hypothetical protein